MRKHKKFLPALATNPVVLFIAFIVVFVFGVLTVAQSYLGGAPKVVVEGDYIEAASPAQQLGGLIHNIQESFDEGIAVDGIERISGTGILVQGGTHTSISSGSETLSADQICDTSILTYDARASTTAVTFPTAAQLIGVGGCLPNPGDQKVIFIENTANNEVITLTAGTTMDLLQASGSNQALNPNERALVQFFNVDDASVSATVIELGDAD